MKTLFILLFTTKVGFIKTVACISLIGVSLFGTLASANSSSASEMKNFYYPYYNLCDYESDWSALARESAFEYCQDKQQYLWDFRAITCGQTLWWGAVKVSFRCSDSDGSTQFRIK